MKAHTLNKSIYFKQSGSHQQIHPMLASKKFSTQTDERKFKVWNHWYIKAITKIRPTFFTGAIISCSTLIPSVIRARCCHHIPCSGRQAKYGDNILYRSLSQNLPSQLEYVKPLCQRKLKIIFIKKLRAIILITPAYYIRQNLGWLRAHVSQKGNLEQVLLLAYKFHGLHSFFYAAGVSDGYSSTMNKQQFKNHT